MSAVPSLESLKDPSALTTLLALLFEPSPSLHSLLVPSVHSQLATSTRLESYNIIIDLCQATSSRWSWQEKADFISGHPMIGEVTGLSKLSGKEQGGGGATPKEVLDRLAHLNQLYCKVYPGLRYITFVNGRSRAEIIPDFESVLGLPASTGDPNEPPIDSEEVEKMVKAPESEEWKKECSRGLADVWLIGRARLSGMGLK
ncbi:hypothetical protein L198_03328 [Cryptococcus wingfieldii CBS 7118]|uniref:Oxo-4-hydroxy-4-carboxy-5-ureidoimidazoline decarboxylase domain-containing protein n=1 Tax=Cryptococcus wingfieldii CBS 7118 TaxID=1295528 RepID=A0A1E3JF66_9TREE|nr:hypothetical protein L198_03328 [Cryptococcus wingfieldii CBS 7118]ODN99484.1 hypothetical protein L198_03328 [Cryptococcus wingfieldii CBS 7118]